MRSAEIDRKEGRLEAACQSLEEIVQIWREVGNGLQLGDNLVTLAHLMRQLGDRASARLYLEEALAAYRQSGSESGMAQVSCLLAS